ncbi:MAG: peptidoglycan D,D-transpeptidase FtsI family protein [Poseidonibacter sp.]|uniref:peptidoglycan D,D-transpeptidase FtsI family protein n=1 Tax=Poseidonibacter sp. TaxID=2321188 RepID=UPI00359D593D
MINEIESNNRLKKMFPLIIFLFGLLIIFIISVFNTIKNDRRVSFINTVKKELAIRGDIISSDNFKIATSKKLYKVSIDTRYLDLNKKELFINLFSIYSDIPMDKILRIIDKSLKKLGYVVLSYSISSRTAKNLKELAFTLLNLQVFIPKEINGVKNIHGLNINESGEKRVNPYKDTFTPVIGYIRKYETENKKTKVKGVKGLENKYNSLLNNSENGILSGKKDVLSYISFNKKSTMKQRIDGDSISLNIPLKLQKNNEMILDIYKKKLNADEIIISIMESKTGKILSLASSNRFNPQRILQKDIPSLNVKAVEYLFEPGSIIKPISIALAMDKNRIKKDELFFAYNFNKSTNKKGEYPKGKYKIGKHTIKDDHRFKKNYLTIDDIVIYSSNIGTLQIAQRLNAVEFLEGMNKFGFSKKTKIDLLYEKTGRLPSLKQFSVGEKDNLDNVYKATVSYGHGMTATFIQMLKAYSVFNNDGFIVTPKLVNTKDKQTNTLEKKEQIISYKTANEIKQLLIKTVNEGTGKSAKINGLEIGGKTGTAQIAKRGKYTKSYISSFFGFVNDGNKSYTIGVTVINPNSKGKYWYQYYASYSAVPVFKEIVNNLVKLDYLYLLK